MNTTFRTGTTYAARSACDHTCVWTFTVVKRTAKFITLQDEYGKVIRCGVRTWSGHEFASPLGTYSMAPVLCSEKVAS